MLTRSRAPVLQLRSVTKYYRGGHGGGVGAGARARARVRALDGVRLSVDAGEVVSLEGPAGSGKTTLLLCAAGLMATDSGGVRWGISAATTRVPPGLCWISSGVYREPEHLARCVEEMEHAWLVLIDEPPFQGEHVRSWLTTIVVGRARHGAGVLRATRGPVLERADRVVRLYRGAVVDSIEAIAGRRIGGGGTVYVGGRECVNGVRTSV